MISSSNINKNIFFKNTVLLILKKKYFYLKFKTSFKYKGNYFILKHTKKNISYILTSLNFLSTTNV